MAPIRFPERGLYLITPDDGDSEALIARVQPVLPFAACLQYRRKRTDGARRRDEAERLRALCHHMGVCFIVNDDPALAREVHADGVHLGEHDGGIISARALLGPDRCIGVSCYDDAALARTATAAGADYVAFGALFPSSTKPGARHATPALFAETRGLGVPRVAIGGITPDNARIAVAADADLVAVIGGVFDAPDPVAAARTIAAAFD
ncbi:MAG: thiamine phosphate synthase [Xanthomonadaceae bacterium]|nr:thiamine phosphate synthase [Xanthomonadaceae bacterium]